MDNQSDIHTSNLTRFVILEVCPSKAHLLGKGRYKFIRLHLPKPGFRAGVGSGYPRQSQDTGVGPPPVISSQHQGSITSALVLHTASPPKSFPRERTKAWTVHMRHNPPTSPPSSRHLRNLNNLTNPPPNQPLMHRDPQSSPPSTHSHNNIAIYTTNTNNTLRHSRASALELRVEENSVNTALHHTCHRSPHYRQHIPLSARPQPHHISTPRNEPSKTRIPTITGSLSTAQTAIAITFPLPQ